MYEGNGIRDSAYAYVCTVGASGMPRWGRDAPDNRQLCLILPEISEIPVSQKIRPARHPSGGPAGHAIAFEKRRSLCQGKQGVGAF
jgi:hypothetical protein